MDKPKVFIAVNGNKRIGFGHVARTLVLANQFKDLDYKVTFFVPYGFLFDDRVTNQGFEVINIGSFDNQEVINLVTNLSNGKIIFIIDCIEDEYKKLSFLSKKTHIYLVSITLFLFNLSYRYENLSFYPQFSQDERKDIRYKQHQLRFYTGKSYLIFRDEFKTNSKKISKIGNSILITMGGTDPYNLTLLTLNSIQNFENVDISVVLNSAAPSFSQVSYICQKNDLKLYSYVDNISDLMKHADIILLNGGTTRYEACLTLTPFIAISIHETQFRITEKLTDNIGAINLGIAERLSPYEIDSAINGLLSSFSERKKISSKMESILDTDGAQRISKIILEESSIYWSDYEY